MYKIVNKIVNKIVKTTFSVMLLKQSDCIQYGLSIQYLLVVCK